MSGSAISFGVRIKRSEALMHRKAYTVDSTVLCTGSANLRRARADNSLIVIRDIGAADKSQNESL
jgi:hypothetical protein